MAVTVAVALADPSATTEQGLQNYDRKCKNSTYLFVLLELMDK
jgi:hypothetical protein